MPSNPQCTGKPSPSNPPFGRTRFSGLLLLLVSAGVCTPLYPALAAGDVPVSSEAINPSWDAPSFLERVRILYLAMGGNSMALGPVGTPDAAMTLLITQYAVSGAPLWLGQEDLADFMAELSDTVCQLRSAPASVRNTPTAILYLKMASSMWIDLGGFPGDLGC